jgi:hypothetical protein
MEEAMSLKLSFKRHFPKLASKIKSNAVFKKYKALRSGRHRDYKELIAYYDTHGEEAEQYASELAFLRRIGRIELIPYEFAEEYYHMDVAVYEDDERKMRYVLHQGKRLYFPDTYPVVDVKESYRSLLREQDANSPHRYRSEALDAIPWDIFADIGAAEGILALELVDKVKHVYIFESEQRWNRALEATFEPWKDKVQIVNKLVSDARSETSLTLDDYADQFMGNTLVKIDVEGHEEQVLSGAAGLIEKTGNALAFICCTYHNQVDAEKFLQFFANRHFTTEFSKGFILSFMDPPLRFRKGLVRAVR